MRQAFADQEGNPWVELAFGTSKNPNRLHPLNFTVSKLSDMDACGLYYATRFDLQRTMTLPFTDEFFEVRFGFHSPTIGRLTDYQIKLLQMQIAFYQQATANQP